MKIIGSTWFTSFAGPTIGIVIANNEELPFNQAYIGTAEGKDQKADEIHIAEYGAHFPLYLAKKLMITSNGMDSK